MSTQPEALLFADRLEAADKRYCMPMLRRAAAELRRLHAENEALRKANALQPIESAPKDGREIGVWSAKRPGVVQLVRWGHPLGNSIAYELAGRHVHLGKLKAVQTCCVGEPS